MTVEKEVKTMYRVGNKTFDVSFEYLEDAEEFRNNIMKTSASWMQITSFDVITRRVEE